MENILTRDNGKHMLTVSEYLPTRPDGRPADGARRRDPSRHPRPAAERSTGGGRVGPRLSRQPPRHLAAPPRAQTRAPRRGSGGRQSAALRARSRRDRRPAQLLREVLDTRPRRLQEGGGGATFRGGRMTTVTDATHIPVRKSIVVDAGPERAFKVFTAEYDSWWPRSHHIGKSPMKKAIIEGKVGGRCYSEQEDGSECDW